MIQTAVLKVVVNDIVVPVVRNCMLMDGLMNKNMHEREYILDNYDT